MVKFQLKISVRNKANHSSDQLDNIVYKQWLSLYPQTINVLVGLRERTKNTHWLRLVARAVNWRMQNRLLGRFIMPNF